MKKLKPGFKLTGCIVSAIWFLIGLIPIIILFLLEILVNTFYYLFGFKCIGCMFHSNNTLCTLSKKNTRIRCHKFLGK